MKLRYDRRGPAHARWLSSPAARRPRPDGLGYASRVTKLPGWVTTNEVSVWRETAEARRMTPAERWRDVVAACDSLRLYWHLPGYPERIRAAVDPLPASTQRALARLREEYRRSRR